MYSMIEKRHRTWGMGKDDRRQRVEYSRQIAAGRRKTEDRRKRAD